MSQETATQTILCIDVNDEVFVRIKNEAWAKTGLVRWCRTQSQPIATMLDRARGATHLLLFVNSNINTAKVWDQLVFAGHDGRAKVISTVSASVRARRTYRGAMPSPVPLEAILPAIVPLSAKATVEWRGSDQATQAAQERFPASDLQLVLEKFFPGWTGTASFDTVDGGRSGAPLVQLLRYDRGEEFYLKFFNSRAAFIREWDGHRHALQWLREYAVDLQPISGLGEAGERQAEAFPTPPLVICFRSASVLTRLKDLYVTRDLRFVLQAYRGVIEALDRNQPNSTGNFILTKAPDVGPCGEDGPTSSLLDSIRSRAQREPIIAAIEALRSYGVSGFVGESMWQLIDARLRAFLFDWEPASLHSPCRVVLGHVHGDANSRNFLFHGTDQYTARGLQIVDTGGYHPEALRVFDLAQLEADLKFILMATETSCGGYLDIDTGRLASWRQEEERAVRDGLRYVAPTPLSPELHRAYKIVECIREKALSLSPADPGGVAYLFCLLYWTLRKARHAGVLPETKRLLALYSSYLLLQKLDSLQRP